MSHYCRQDVLRILGIRSRELRDWERRGIFPFRETYSFQDLARLRTLRDLRSSQVTLSSIRDSIVAMRAVSGMEDPLLELAAVRTGSGLVFRHSGAMLNPVTRQLSFDFDSGPRLVEVASPRNETEKRALIQSIFVKAVEAEEAGLMNQAAELYSNILELEPGHAAAAINLGTIYYNQRKFVEAEGLYRRAAESDPGYALAHFDLGNVLDELGRLQESIEAYQTAIQLTPGYADAHYNLALAYERLNERRSALRHWQCYLRLDRSGPWAHHARMQMKKLLEREKMVLVQGNGVRRRVKPGNIRLKLLCSTVTPGLQA